MLHLWAIIRSGSRNTCFCLIMHLNESFNFKRCLAPSSISRLPVALYQSIARPSSRWSTKSTSVVAVATVMTGGYREAEYTLRSRAHLLKNKPNVFNWVFKDSGDGLEWWAIRSKWITERSFGSLWIVVLLLMEGHQASMSWMTNSFSMPRCSFQA